jgi:CHAT domain-containing protein
MSGPRVVLAEYLVTDSATLVFIVRAEDDEPSVVTVDLDRDELRAIVAEGFGFDREPAAWQGPLQPLLAPVVAASSPDDLLWLVPHDVLHYVPLHALEVDGRPLVERNPVCSTPSASVMRYCRAKPRPRRGLALVFADSSEDRPLTHARDQALTIRQLYGTRATWEVGPRATRDTLLRRTTGAKRLEVVHLACHGEFDDDDPMRSGILLASGDVLTAADLFGMQLDAHLVVLSACESGVNAQRPGDELIGLTRSLIYAGASAVLVSLWSVDEISTSILMAGFYRGLRAGRTKAEALRVGIDEVRRITVAQVVEFCRAAIERHDEAFGANDPSGRAQLAVDIADMRALAGDLAVALKEYEALLEHLPGDGLQYQAALQGAARCRLELRGREAADLVPDYTEQPFDHPYYWAPFVLVGDWR